MKLRPDQRVVVQGTWGTPDAKLQGVKALLEKLAPLEKRAA